MFWCHSDPAVPASGQEGEQLWQSHLCLHGASNKDRSIPVGLVIITAQQTAGFRLQEPRFPRCEHLLHMGTVSFGMQLSLLTRGLGLEQQGKATGLRCIVQAARKFTRCSG